MFGRLTAVLNSAADVLAPPIPLQDEFVYHWEAITKFFLDTRSDSKAPIQDTRIPLHLDEMLSILTQEEEENSGEETGLTLCMEYVIQNKLMDTMCTLAGADCPPGMKQQILLFFTKLLSRSKQPLLAQINVHRPAHRLVKMCGEVSASPFEREEMHFICVICAKIRVDPHLFHCFIETNIQSPTEKSDHASADSLSSHSNEFSIIKSILTLIQSADTWISVKACEGLLLLCTSLPDLKAANILVNHTEFCSYLINRLASLYSALPFDVLDQNNIDEVHVKWGLSDAEDMNEFQGKRQLSCYLSWLDYINNLCVDSHSKVQSGLASTFTKNFLNEALKPTLIVDSEKNILVTLSLIARSFRQMTAKVLLQEFTKHFLGDKMNSYFEKNSLHAMNSRLTELGNCKASPEISLSTLKLYEEMILKFDEDILYSLVLSTLVGRDYYDAAATDDSSMIVSNSSINLLENNSIFITEDFEEVSPGSSPASRTMAPSNIQKVMKCFLTIVPEDIKSCATEEEIGFEHYVRDAHNQYQACVLRCLEFDWPSEAISKEEMNGGDDASSDSQPEADKQQSHFYEGSFLALLFDKLEDILNQPYEIILEITSVISKLALMPHPYLHEYLLNPFIPLAQGSRSLLSILTKVAIELREKLEDIDEYKEKLHLTRQMLLGYLTDFDSFDQGNVIEAVIVIEEFCKELAAIAFVKYHASS